MSSDQPGTDMSAPGTSISDDAIREWNLAQGIDPNARVAIRYATQADKGLRQQAKQSEWYKRHGRTAGKERAGNARENRYEDGGDYSFNGREGDEVGGGREFARRIGRERKGPYDRRPGGGRRDQSDLDRELDGMVRRRAVGESGEGDVDMDVDAGGYGDRRRHGGGGGGGRGRGGQRRERRGVEDLDKGKFMLFLTEHQAILANEAELDDLFAARTADR